ncbi:MAG: hypothetical protein SCALA702_00830 [Melioribacteraceae bacterium]|nr:MAG: hypothetical protein SCALA702_00830 [Melioribacteraceae bacterium]
MPSLITFDELKKMNREIITESADLMKTARAHISEKNVFLSYSSTDLELLPSIIKILNKHGGNPYIDKGDESLPKIPSVKTAKILKDNIKSCKRMVLFVTTNSKDSKWIPWELGLGDGSKTQFDIALFPSAEKSHETTWLKQEYLGLYRRIVYGNMKGNSDGLWMVWDHIENTATPLKDWLKSY